MCEKRITCPRYMPTNLPSCVCSGMPSGLVSSSLAFIVSFLRVLVCVPLGRALDTCCARIPSVDLCPLYEHCPGISGCQRGHFDGVVRTMQASVCVRVIAVDADHIVAFVWCAHRFASR